MSSTAAVQKRIATVAIVHHANQYVITDGYDDRIGISAIIGNPGSQTGLTRVLQLHERYKVPFSLHISGTLLEALSWHAPDFLSKIEHLGRLGLVELIGGSYGQNMMRFFSRDHNLRQLKEELLLYKSVLDWDPRKVTAFWPTERLWETEAMAPILTDSGLQNGGYRYVVLDDRLLYASTGSPSPRQEYDHDHTWDPSNFQTYRIKNGLGLLALPISFNLRQNTPPRTAESLEKTKAQLHWVLDINSHYENRLIAIYADDMEKPAGVGWDPEGPSQFEATLKWISENPFLSAVKLGEWSSTQTQVEERQIDTGAYSELAIDFEAGENFEKWYYDPRWTPYREYYSWSEKRVREIDSKEADPALIELAWNTLLGTTWQTAWHTPQTGAHGEPTSDKGPSGWARAIASHSRIAPIIAEAAQWMTHHDTQAHSYLRDLDWDGKEELVLQNENLFAVISPSNGGRLVYLFTINKPPGRLVIGNPIDDWNMLEGLHDYMDNPPNHPGALSDVGYEHDPYSVRIEESDGTLVSVALRNSQENSAGLGIEKKLSLQYGETSIRVDYSFPNSMPELSTEIGLSPDYLQLLRRHCVIRSIRSSSDNVRGWANGGVRTWVRLDRQSAAWGTPRRQMFGHGYMLRIIGQHRFVVWMGAESS